MNETSFFLAVLTLSATLLVIALATQRRAAACARRRACGKEASWALLELLQATQQHRGLSSTMLSGRRDLCCELPARRQRIARALDTLQALAEASSTPLEVISRGDVLQWRHGWNSLLAELDDMSSSQSASRHTELIARPVSWLAGVGETMLASTLDRGEAQQRLRAALGLMPALSETLGQARALGSSMLAGGRSDAVARVRMAYLMQRADSLVAEYQKLAACSTAADLGTERQFVQRVKETLIAQTRPTWNAGDYFEHATRAIDSTFVRMRGEIGIRHSRNDAPKRNHEQPSFRRAA